MPYIAAGRGQVPYPAAAKLGRGKAAFALEDGGELARVGVAYGHGGVGDACALGQQSRGLFDAQTA